MIDTRSFATSLKCKWVKLYLDDNRVIGRFYLTKNLNKYGKGSLFQWNFVRITYAFWKPLFVMFVMHGLNLILHYHLEFVMRTNAF